MNERNINVKEHIIHLRFRTLFTELTYLFRVTSNTRYIFPTERQSKKVTFAQRHTQLSVMLGLKIEMETFFDNNTNEPTT